MSGTKRRRVMVGSIGDCVHNLGVEGFADCLEDSGQGYVSVKLGPAVPIAEVVRKIQEARPEVVGISTRLGDLHVDKLVGQFIRLCSERGLHPKDSGIRYCFGGLRPAANLVRAMTGQALEPDAFTKPEEQHYDLAAIAAEYAAYPEFVGFFELIADDFITPVELGRFALGLPQEETGGFQWSDDLLERIRQVRERENRPVLRAHIGIAAESIEPTIAEIQRVAATGALEIVSLGPDQPTQQYLPKFIRGEEDPDKYLKGQGGVPIRSREDLERLKAATQTGNHPTCRIYSGTDELLYQAELYEQTLNMAFPAVPIFYYNKLDGRGPLPVREGFEEHFEVMRWWAAQEKPLEINDPHQWQLRDASDDMLVCAHVVAGVVALKMGIKNYIMQMMTDLPPGTSALNDLAKMWGSYELIEPLTRHFDYNIIRETRGGLNSFPPNLYEAKGHLAYVTTWNMFLKPDIIHVVSFPEAHHEATAEDIIESCDIVKYVVKDFQKGAQPDVLNDAYCVRRRAELKKNAMYTLLHLALLGGYKGRVSLDEFEQWAVTPAEAAERSDPALGERHFESLLLDLIDERNYATGACGMISADTLDMALQTGLFQAPKITMADDPRYRLTGACRTQIVGGECRIESFMGRRVSGEMERVDLVRRRAPWFFDKSISVADDITTISEVAEEITPAVIQEFRQRYNIDVDAGRRVLVMDFGSTFTKVGLFDTAAGQFELKYVPTTVEDLRRGLANALGVDDRCAERGDWAPLQEAVEAFDYRFACSSAKGGLKVVVVGLVPEESTHACELAALAAGAKLLGSYSGRLSEAQVAEIYSREPEIIILSGGVDHGGEAAVQLHNARLLAAGKHHAAYARYGVPVIYAGNQDVAAAVQAVFTGAGIDCRVAPNVMPEINEFRIDALNEVIRDLFQTIIIRGKGFDVIEEFLTAPLIPTPRAAFLGINLLARGYGDQKGLGNILALDIGGATTDFYASVSDNPIYQYEGPESQKRAKRPILKTPGAPRAYRRVEGKYGMSYDAENLVELPRFVSGRLQQELNDYFSRRFPAYLPERERDHVAPFVRVAGGRRQIDLAGLLTWISQHPHQVPATPVETAVHAFLAREIMREATRNHVGHVQETDTYFLHHGVNFTGQDVTTLLIGGTIYHKCKEGRQHLLDDLKVIADGALYNPTEPYVLRPRGRVILDASYLVSIVGGLYGRVDPQGALRLMKSHLRPLVEHAGEAADAAAGRGRSRLAGD